MSRLGELIKKLCPDGVEYKKIDEICVVLTGGEAPSNSIKSKEPIGNMIYPIYSNGIGDNSLWGFSNSYRVDRDSVTFSSIGTIGYPTIRKANFTPIIRLKVLYPIDDKILNLSFLKYSLEIVEFESQKSSVPNINANMIKEIEIPVPPLPIQDEIVRILDNFTNLTAELTAELTARKKQYEYYRDSLLTFNNDVKIVKVKDCFKRIKGTPITAEKMKEIESVDGDVKIFAGGKTQIFAFENDIPNANIIRVPAVLVQSRGLIDFIYYDEPFTFKNEMWAYTNDNITTLKYLYHYFKNNIDYFRNSSSGMGAMPQISLTITEDFKIYLPSLDVQKRIVNVLDNFEKICNDLQIGLPAELELRRKQYEYYRDLLLTFPERGFTMAQASKQASKQAKLSEYYAEIKLLQYVYGFVCFKLDELFDYRNGYTPSKSDEANWHNGTIPWFRLDDINTKGRILFDSFQHISSNAIKKSGLFDKDSFMISTSATIGEYAIVKNPFLCNQRFTVLTLKKEYKDIVNMDYILQCGVLLAKYCKNNLNKGNFASVDMVKFTEFIFNIPSIEEQNHIVSLLDKFDKYCNDITEGLPAEIKYRQQQYEYYRDKLLNFKD